MATETKTADETAVQIAADRATRRNELAEINYQGGNLFVPATGRELMDMANLMAQAGPMVPEMYRGQPGACMALIAVCAGYGLNPIMTSWHTYKVSPDAPIAYEGKVINAMINASGILSEPFDYSFDGTGPDRVCTVSGKLKSGAVRTYASPRFADIRPKKGTHWANDPDQAMCYWAARAWVRRHTPQIMLGIYSEDEMDPAIGPDNARDVTPRGGRSYREAGEEPAQAAENDGGKADEAEVVDQTTGEVDNGREGELKAEAARQAERGKDSFVKWWNGALTKDERSLFAPPALWALHAACVAADEAAAQTAAEAAVEAEIATTVAADAGDLK